MDPETAKAIVQLAKIVAPVAAASPTVGDLVKRVVGPTADLFGERIRKCFERSDQMVYDARETTQNAAPNIVIPLIQAAALAEHETIQEMFAALLTNARIPDGNAARPSFISIVSQLAPDEAMLFKAIGTLSDEYRVFQLGFNHIPQPQRMAQATSFVEHYLVKVRNALPVVQDESDGNRKLRCETCILVLEGLRLVTNQQVSHAPSPTNAPIPVVSELGWALLRACRPPEPKAS